MRRLTDPPTTNVPAIATPTGNANQASAIGGTPPAAAATVRLHRTTATAAAARIATASMRIWPKTNVPRTSAAATGALAGDRASAGSGARTCAVAGAGAHTTAGSGGTIRGG